MFHEISIFLLTCIFFTSLFLPLFKNNKPPIHKEQDKIIIQVSDTHLSLSKPDRTLKFDAFFKAIQTIEPDIIIHTGDITDSKHSIGGRNIAKTEEWDLYKEILGNYTLNKYIDLPGNHDASDAITFSEKNLFYLNSHPSNRKSRIVTYENIVAIDLNKYPKPSSPIGFFPGSDKELFNELETILKKIENPILATHFPLSLLDISIRNTKSRKKFIEILKENNITLNLSGHLHSKKGGKVFNGIVDIPIPSLMNNGLFRIIIFDKGRLAYSDIKYNNSLDNPIIIITSPIDKRICSNPSNGIRAFIFNSIEPVIAYIDDKPIGKMIKQSKYLYTLPDFNSSSLKKNSIISIKSGNLIKFQSPKKFPKSFVSLIQSHNLPSFLQIWMFIFTFFNFILILTLKRVPSFTLFLLFSFSFILPQFIGIVRNNEFGISWVWGLLIHGKLIHNPGGLFWQSFYLMTILTPTIYILSSPPTYLIITALIIMAGFFWVPIIQITSGYSIIAVILSPGYTWLSLYCFYLVNKHLTLLARSRN